MLNCCRFGAREERRRRVRALRCGGRRRGRGRGEEDTGRAEVDVGFLPRGVVQEEVRQLLCTALSGFLLFLSLLFKDTVNNLMFSALSIATVYLTLFPFRGVL